MGRKAVGHIIPHSRKGHTMAITAEDLAIQQLENESPAVGQRPRRFTYDEVDLARAVYAHNHRHPGNKLRKELVEYVRDLILDGCDAKGIVNVDSFTEIQMASMLCDIRVVTQTTSGHAESVRAIIVNECADNDVVSVAHLCAEQTVRMVGNIQAEASIAHR